MDENKQKTILIVDDDTFLLNMYVTKFQKAGYEVNTARSGVEVLKKLEEGYRPNIMLLDVVLPGMDGIELLKEIQMKKLADGTIFVMFTNQGGGEEIEQAKKLGVSDYIIKASLVPSEIVSKVLEIVGRKNS